MLESPLQHGLCGSPRPQAFSGPGYEVRARELQNKETCTKMCSEARTCLGQKLISHTRPQQLLSVALHPSSRGSQSWLPIRITWRDRNTPGRSASTLGLLSQDLGGWEPSLNRLSGSQMIPMCSHGGGGAPLPDLIERAADVGRAVEFMVLLRRWLHCVHLPLRTRPAWVATVLRGLPSAMRQAPRAGSGRIPLWLRQSGLCQWLRRTAHLTEPLLRPGTAPRIASVNPPGAHKLGFPSLDGN